MIKPQSWFVLLTALAVLCLRGSMRGEDDAARRKQTELNTNLASAIAASDYEGVKKHVAAGANVNEVNENYAQQTPLIDAVSRGDVEMIELLLKLGAKVEVRDNYGHTALHAAADTAGYVNANLATNREKIIRLLLKAGADVNAGLDSGRTPLAEAAGDFAMVKMLLDAGAKVNGEALRSAAQKGQPEVFEEFLKRGARATDLSTEKQTLIHVIAGSDPHSRADDGPRLVILDRLLALKVPLDAVDEDGRTALHLAAGSWDLGVMRWLLEHHADPHLRDKSGHSVLSLTVRGGPYTAPMAMLLHDHGVPLDDVGDGEGDFFDALLDHQNWEAFRPLLEAGWRPRVPAHFLLVLARAQVEKPMPPKLLSSIIARFAPALDDPNVKDNDGFTLLHWVVRGGDLASVQWLLKERHLKVDQRDSAGRTALIWSGMVGSESIRQRLLEAGANASLKDDTGRDAQTYLALTRPGEIDDRRVVDDGSTLVEARKPEAQDIFAAINRDDTGLLEMLMAKDRTVRKQTRGNQQPLAFAAALGRLKSFQMLLRAGAAKELPEGEESPGSLAIRHDHIDVALAWLRREHDAITDSEGAAVYLTALQEGNRSDRARQLFDAGVPMGEQAWRCLRVSAIVGDEDFCRRLFEHHVPVIRPAREKNPLAPLSALSDAARSGKPGVLRLFLSQLKQPANAVDAAAAQSLMDEALVEACGKGNEESVKLLLNATPAPQVNQKPGRSSEDRSNDALDRNAFRELGSTPLEVAAAANNISMLKLLMEHGAKIAGDDVPSGGMLMAAMKHGSAEAFDLLLDHGADVRDRNDSGDTPLHVAAGLGDERAVRRLLAAGADPAATNRSKKTPADVASFTEHEEIAQLLKTQAQQGELFAPALKASPESAPATSQKP